MAPSKSDEAEVMRREKARRVRSMRRSTQAIDIGGYKQLEEKKTLETVKDVTRESMELETKPNSNESTEIEFSVIESPMIFTDKKINDMSKSECKSIESEKADQNKFDIPIITSAPANPKTNSSFVVENPRRGPIKYQVSCPVPYVSLFCFY